MVNEEGGYINMEPMFNGMNYVLWKVGMSTYIQSLGVNVCDAMEEEYQNPQALITKDQNMEFKCNAKDMNALIVCLPESELVKVIDCTATKEIYDKMVSFYEGDNKVKQTKVQVLRMHF